MGVNSRGGLCSMMGDGQKLPKWPQWLRIHVRRCLNRIKNEIIYEATEDTVYDLIVMAQQMERNFQNDDSRSQ